jgi:hypothetical protein
MHVVFVMLVLGGLLLSLVRLMAHEAFLRNRRTEVTDEATVPAGRAALAADHCFMIPPDLPRGGRCDLRRRMGFTSASWSARRFPVCPRGARAVEGQL